MILNTGKGRLGSSSPDVSGNLYFWFDLVLGKRELGIGSQALYKEPTSFPASLTMDRIFNLHFTHPGVR